MNHMMCSKKKTLRTFLFSRFGMFGHMQSVYFSLISEPFNRPGFFIFIYYYRRNVAASGMLASPRQHNLLVDVFQTSNIRYARLPC